MKTLILLALQIHTLASDQARRKNDVQPSKSVTKALNGKIAFTLVLQASPPWSLT
jgi:hypothetical protein